MESQVRSRTQARLNQIREKDPEVEKHGGEQADLGFLSSFYFGGCGVEHFHSNILTLKVTLELKDIMLIIPRTYFEGIDNCGPKKK